MSHSKQAKYLQIWEPDILLSYYQKKIAISLGFFFMLRPFEAYQAKILNNPKYESNPQSSF
jgi:hypothetical protein